MSFKNIVLLLSVSIFLFISFNELLSDGMFLDGVTYAAISNNLANGNGAFWKLYYTPIWDNFYEHPPLAIYLNSLLFRLFGDHILIERIYSILTFIITGFGLVKVWKLIIKDDNFSTLPLLFWSLFPTVTWAISNNILENTMSIFIVFSVYFYLKDNTKSLTNVVISGVLLSCAFLSKGLTGLYLWSLPFFYHLIVGNKDFKKIAIHTTILVLFTVLPIYIITLLFPDAKDFLLKYFDRQIIGSINNVKTVDSRFYIIRTFFEESLIPFLIVVLVFIISKIKNLKQEVTNQKWILLFFLLALSGIIPITISQKQSSFYILTVYPFMSIVFGLMVYSLIQNIGQHINFNRKTVNIISGIIVLAFFVSIILSLSKIGSISRNKTKISDCKKIINEVGINNTIGLCNGLKTDWSLYAYIARYGNVGLSTKAKSPYTLSKDNCIKDKNGKKEVNLNLEEFKLLLSQE